jgi:ferrous iron transport protein B
MKTCCDNTANHEKNTTERFKPIHKIALIGNPNSGKTTLFNRMTGSSQRTGNWPGVTVERKEGKFKYHEQHYKVVDLPGVYMLDGGETSVDEQITRNFLHEHPDYLFINIIDASTLERGLFLSTEIREQGVNTIVLLNMMDVANKRNMKIKQSLLAEELGCPVISVSLKKDKELELLCQSITEFDIGSQKNIRVEYPAELESVLLEIQQDDSYTREKAIDFLQKDIGLKANIEKETGDELNFLLADGRFEYAKNLAHKAIIKRGKISRTYSDKLDKWILGSWTGIPIFLALMYLLFLFSINFGGALIDFFDMATGALLVDGASHLLQSLGSPKWLNTLIADGVGGGIQVVATFIPIIGALFLFLTLLEESGYMSRAAFVMDRFMRRLGISGKAFVPLIVGFGCNVPGIMATRTLDSQRERIITVMMSPFMSCGARLAVYVLFASAFFPKSAQNIVFLLYLLGIFFAIATGFLLRKTILKGEADDFFMELPGYQIPSLKNVLINTWNKLKGFILGAGRIIVLVVMVINVANSIGTDGSFGNQDTEKSVLSATAKMVTPIFAPMGIHQDNWPATVGIITGLLAKEVVVGTLDSLYSKIDQVEQAPQQEEPFELGQSLLAAFSTIPTNMMSALNNITDPLGLGAVSNTTDLEKAAQEQQVSASTFGAMVKRFDGKIGAFAYLLFILMYFPCVAATGAMYREVGTRWTLMGVGWSTGLGYAIAVLFYQLGTFSAHPTQSLIWTAIIFVLFAIVIYTLLLAGKKMTNTEKVAIST